MLMKANSITVLNSWYLDVFQIQWWFSYIMVHFLVLTTWTQTGFGRQNLNVTLKHVCLPIKNLAFTFTRTLYKTTMDV